MPELSVIIPTLNEADHLPSLLQALQRQQAIELEVIIADGGSIDASQQLAIQAGGQLVQAPAGRARQMNLGAQQAKAPWLLFLHADSSLSSSTQLSEAIKALGRFQLETSSDCVAGHFRLKFLRSLPGHDLAYRYYEEKSGLNRAECTNGDQGMLLSQDFYKQLGGFDESLWFLEDQRLAEKIRQQGAWLTLPGELGTSARRFEQEGLAQRMILSALIMNFHAMGLSEFFHRANSVYQDQAKTGRLQLLPVFELIEQMNREAGRQISRQRWLATGRYVLRHAWQPFFFLDIVLKHRWGVRRTPFLSLYDRLLQPLSGFRPMHYLAAGCVWLWFVIYRRSLAAREGKKLGDD